MNKPLADLLRPTSLDEMVGQTHLLGKDSVFRKVIESKKVQKEEAKNDKQEEI